MYAPERVAGPEAQPVTRGEAKAHLRIETDEDDALIDGLIETATAHFDGWTGVLGRCLVTQTWRLKLDRFCDPIRLPMPASAISAIISGGDAVSASVYELLHDAAGSYVTRKDGQSWPTVPSGNAKVAVDFVAGYGAAAAVPLPIRTAILILVGHLYDNRGGSNQGGPPAVLDVLIRPYRRVTV
jgi:uncharacterized phiE125 gp8 family phage protein